MRDVIEVARYCKGVTTRVTPPTRYILPEVTEVTSNFLLKLVALMISMFVD